MEIKVGDYIRTIDGIKRIVKINTGDRKTIFGQYRLDKPYKGSYSIAEKNILEHNKNIKKLIKVGDIVTVFSDLHDRMGNQTLKVENEEHLKHLLTGFNGGYFHLKSIVTKEQFENVEYKVGE